MTRKWLVVSTLIIVAVLFWIWRKTKIPEPANNNLHAVAMPSKEPVWSAPDSNSIPMDESGKLIRYGKKLIRNTARYFGPGGSVSHTANGMNCQNCHLD